MLKFIITFAQAMRISTKISSKLLKRKLATLLLVTASVAAFATLGDGGTPKKPTQGKTLLTHKPVYNYKLFSLKTGYNYRGNNIFGHQKTENKYVTQNTLITYEKGNTTYILPMKKKLVLNTIKFNSTPVRY